jgi:hypothetical protein
MDLKKYAGNRRMELKAERESLSSQMAAGITTGRLMGFDQRAAIIEVVLAELEKLGAWEASGEPEFVPPMGEAERGFWLKALDRGVPVPDEIKAQL